MSVIELKSTRPDEAGITFPRHGKAVADFPSSAKPRKERLVHYPDGDGKPVAETVEHRDDLFYAVHATKTALQGRPDVWVSGNDFIYYQKGNPKKRLSPDCYAVIGVPVRPRPSYKLWEENGKGPNFVLELTSPGTAYEDRTKKFDLYRDILKVNEYILFDPLNQYLRPRLQGFRLVNGVYVPIVPDAEGRIYSQEINVWITAEGVLPRFVLPSGEKILTITEEVAARREAEAAQREAEAAQREAEAAREQERERAEMLAAKLRALGIDPDTL